jgi:hypothetical protein
MGVDEIYLGRKQKFLTLVSNLETGEPLWLRGERKKQGPADGGVCLMSQASQEKLHPVRRA